MLIFEIFLFLVQYRRENEEKQGTKSQRDPKRHKNHQGMQKRSSEPSMKSPSGKNFSESETLPKNEDV